MLAGTTSIPKRVRHEYLFAFCFVGSCHGLFVSTFPLEEEGAIFLMMIVHNENK
jgi:hypothetical protein